MPTELLAIDFQMLRVELHRLMLMWAAIILELLEACTSNTEKIAKLFVSH